MTVRDDFPDAHVERLRRYLRALLAPDAAERALTEALDNARYWRDREFGELVLHAHNALEPRANVPVRTEAAVLVTVAGVDPRVAGRVLGISADEAAAAADAYRDGSTDAVEAAPDRTDPGTDVDPVATSRTEPMASPTGPPPEAIGEELREHLRREDRGGHRYPRGVRLELVGAAIGVFLAFLVVVVTGGLSP